MVHTRFFGSTEVANDSFAEMKNALDVILAMIPLSDEPDLNVKARRVEIAIARFVERFP